MATSPAEKAARRAIRFSSFAQRSLWQQGTRRVHLFGGERKSADDCAGEMPDGFHIEYRKLVEGSRCLSASNAIAVSAAMSAILVVTEGLSGRLNDP